MPKKSTEFTKEQALEILDQAEKKAQEACFKDIMAVLKKHGYTLDTLPVQIVLKRS